MQSWQIIATVFLVVVAGGLLAWVAVQKRRTETLAEQFGPEYHATLRGRGDRRGAEEDLAQRVRRFRSLPLRRLTRDEESRYAATWREVQAQFVENPARAIDRADELVQEVMSVRGYPMGDFEQRAEDISVNHPLVVDEYRAAHEIAERHGARGVDTEQLRRAMVHYYALFEDLLEAEPEPEQRRERSRTTSRGPA